MTVNVLGAQYTIDVKKYADEESFERRSIDGFCDGMTKEIVVCDMHTYKGREHETEKTICATQKHILRHEIVHAFFNKSGLMDSSFQADVPWARSEEMIDWIAIQGQKIYAAWREAGALDA